MPRTLSIAVLFSVLLISSQIATAQRWERRSGRSTRVVACVTPVQSVSEGAIAAQKVEASLVQLRQQRVAIATENYGYMETRYATGTKEMGELIKAAELLSQAELEAATAPSARLLSLQRAVQNAEAGFQLAEGRFRGGAGPKTDLLLADYALITAKLRLGEEEQRQLRAGIQRNPGENKVHREPQQHPAAPEPERLPPAPQP